MPDAKSKVLLSDKFAKTAEPNARHWDSKLSGFFLRTGKTSRTWCVERKGRVHNLGRWPDVSASDARIAAQALMATTAKLETSPTLENALRDYLGRDKLRSSHNKRSVDAMMHNHMQRFMGRRLHTITKQELRDAFKALSQQRPGKDALGRSCVIGGTRIANHVMQSFRTIWNHASNRMMDGELKACPTSALELHYEAPPKDTIKDLDEWRAQIALIDPMHRMFYELLLLTGMRKMELLSLRWQDVAVDRIHLHNTKNGRPYDVALEPEHHKILDVLRSLRRANVDWLFWSPKGDDHLKQVQKVEVLGCIVTPQMHRRTFATLGVQAGLAPWQVGQLLNHTIAGVTSKNYIDTQVDHYRPFMRAYLDHLVRLNVVE